MKQRRLKPAFIGTKWEPLFSAVGQGLLLSEVRSTILQGTVIQKTAYSTREKIWNAIWHQYLSLCPSWVGQSLAYATKQGMHSTEYLSLTYLYFALRDRLVFDLVTGPIWDKWQRQTTAITRGDLLEFLEQQSEDFPNIKKWREVYPPEAEAAVFKEWQSMTAELGTEFDVR